MVVTSPMCPASAQQVSHLVFPLPQPPFGQA